MSQLPSSIDPNLLPSSEMTPAPAQKKLDSELPKTNKNQIKPSMKEEDNNNKDGDKADKKKKNHTWTDDQRVALVTFILDQIALGKGTDNGNLKAEAWNQVVKEMNTRFDIQFDREQVKNQKGAIRKLYIDMKFLLAQSGFA
ncbi:hypothetical protein PCANC_12148 [Puccinia coronata f. sp. avenae]|uniref:Myb/SANT-like domain-containing protein n=1 Tax=Puccinia coronata f. sp. avenae TaxID=200324 RepID=A0A2N5VGD5_9BASI|nr:hypothetical protein PCANC_12148 [Puccinia coronata f. sp. avenae]